MMRRGVIGPRIRCRGGNARSAYGSLAYVRAARSRRCHRSKMLFIIMCRVAAPQNTRRALVATPVPPRPCSHAAMRLNRLYGIRDLWHRRLTRASRIGYVPICATRMLPARRDAAYGILTMCSRHPWYDAATRHTDDRVVTPRCGFDFWVGMQPMASPATRGSHIG